MKYRRSTQTISILLLAPALALVLLVPFAQAHVLDADSDVTAVLHIVPTDEPVAGVETTAGLQFSSKDPTFDLSQYAVDVALQGASVNASSPPVAVTPDATDPLYGTVSIQFPQPGSYNLLVRGVSAGHKNTFNLTFEVRAKRKNPVTSSAINGVNNATLNCILLAAISFGLLLIIAHWQIKEGGRYVPKPGKHRQTNSK